MKLPALKGNYGIQTDRPTDRPERLAHREVSLIINPKPGDGELVCNCDETDIRSEGLFGRSGGEGGGIRYAPT